MSRKYTNIGVALVLFASVVALAAWWLLPREDSAASVWAAVQSACENMRVTSYDVVHTYSIRGAPDIPDVDGRIESRYSGGNVHRIGTATTPEGILLSRSEEIVKDGVRYSRGSISDDDPSNLSEWSVYENASSGDPLPCFPSENSESSDVSGRSAPGNERHYSYTTVVDEGEVTEITEKREFWVDAAGRPTRGRRTLTQPNPDDTSDAGGASGASDDSSGSSGRTLTVDEAYSGFGEANVITVPITPTPIPATATPTPVPPTATPVPDGVLHIAVSADNSNPSVNQPVNLTATVHNGPDGLQPSFYWEIGIHGAGVPDSWFKHGSNSTLRYLGSAGETVSFRATVTYSNGDSLTSDPVSVTWSDPGT